MGVHRTNMGMSLCGSNMIKQAFYVVKSLHYGIC
jgi:hypothetical protein